MSTFSIIDSKTDYRKRVFYVLSNAGIFSNAVGLIVNIVMYNFGGGFVACLVCLAIIAAAALYGSVTGRLRLPTAIIVGVGVIFEYPVMYISLRTPAVPLMIMGLVTIFVFCEKKLRVKLCSAVALYDITVMILRFIHRDSLPQFDPVANFGAGICAFIVASMTIFLYLAILINRLETENSELKSITEELRTANRLDSMTGLFNRRYLSEYCESLISEKKGFCAAIIDLDDCAKINDEYGVAYTDTIITEFAGIVNNAVSGNGITARFGGQKFMVIFLGGVRRLEDLLDNVRKEYAAYSMSEKQREFTFSSGIVEYEEGMELAKLFKLTEEKLTRAKTKGKNKIVSS